jgi:hypothetical protein
MRGAVWLRKLAAAEAPGQQRRQASALALQQALRTYRGGCDGRDVAEEIGLDVTGERKSAFWPGRLAQALHSGHDLMNRR